MAIHWVVDQWTMWEKQSHKPPMTGKGTQFHLSMVKLRMAQMALFYPRFQWWFLMWWFNGVIGILWTELCWKWNMGFKLLHTVGMGSQASKYEDFHGHLMAGSSSGPRGKRYMGFTFDFHRFMMDLWWIYGGLMRIDKDFSQGFFWRLFLGIFWESGEWLGGPDGFHGGSHQMMWMTVVDSWRVVPFSVNDISTFFSTPKSYVSNFAVSWGTTTLCVSENMTMAITSTSFPLFKVPFQFWLLKQIRWSVG